MLWIIWSSRPLIKMYVTVLEQIVLCVHVCSECVWVCACMHACTYVHACAGVGVWMCVWVCVWVCECGFQYVVGRGSGEYAVACWDMGWLKRDVVLVLCLYMYVYWHPHTHLLASSLLQSSGRKMISYVQNEEDIIGTICISYNTSRRDMADS